MARYIDADKVMEEINRIGGHNLCEWETIGVKALIDRQPTADVVEVVRCKGCKSYNGHRFCLYHADPCLDNDFCSYGEKSSKERERG